MRASIVGIDLGTSTSVVAHADAAGHVTILADDSGYKVHPSVVSFHPSGGVVVGAAAKQRRVIDPRNTIYSVKRMIGRAFSTPEVTTTRARVPFEIKAGDNDLPLIVTRAGEFAAPEISAIVLDHVKHLASAQLEAEVDRAIVTVPASFNDAQRSATATAGAIAGLEVVRVINEPTAAALAYGHARQLRSTIAVYDFGGGTFDVTILQLRDHVYEVLGTAGDTFLGGDDLDERLVDKMIGKFLAESRIDLRMNEVAMIRLRAVAEQTKIELSRRARALVRIDEIAYGEGGKPLDFRIEITRDELVSEIAEIVDRTFPVCSEALRYAGLAPEAIDDVLLVGGTTKIPYVRDQVSRFFGKAPRTDINPEDAVAAGAALQAAALEPALPLGAPVAVSVALPAPAAPAAEVPAEVPTEDTTEVVALEEPVTMQTYTELESPPVAPSRSRRVTAGYAASPPRPPGARAETEYSLPRAGTREVFDERPPAPPTTRPPLPDGALARLKVTSGDRSARSPAATALGIPPAPAPSAPAPTPIDADELAAAPMLSEALLLEWGAPDAEPGQRAPESAGMAPLDLDALIALDEPPGSAPSLAPSPARAPTSAPLVMEVTPRGLGIATVAGFCEELIRRNSRLPAHTVKSFTTSRDRQSAVRIVVCQGESRRLDSNTVIGDLRLEGLPARPRGETSIEVTFALDASGVLQVTARDAQTGAEQHAALDLVGGLREQDVAASRERIQQLRR